MKIKVNCGISSSNQSVDPLYDEVQKAESMIDAGADYLSHISIYEDSIKKVWNELSKIDLKQTILCGVPLYESCLFNEPILDVIKRYYELYHVRCVTLHLTKMSTIKKAIDQNFKINSRGGIFLVESRKDINPIEGELEKIIDYCLLNKIKVHIGTALRPGSIDICPEINSLVLEDLKTARSYYDKFVNIGLDCEIECMGHVSFNQLSSYSYYLGSRKICSMGPLVSDAVNGYDEINALFGYHLAMDAGLNIQTCCMLTRSEHIKIPTLDDNLDAIKKFKVYGHLYDITHKTSSTNDSMNKELSIISKKTLQREQCSAHINIFGEMDIPEHCNICGDHCPLEMKKKGLIK